MSSINIVVSHLSIRGIRSAELQLRANELRNGHISCDRRRGHRHNRPSGLPASKKAGKAVGFGPKYDYVVGQERGDRREAEVILCKRQKRLDTLDIRRLSPEASDRFSAGSPPVVHLTARKDNGNWIFSAKANGIGIEPQHKERSLEYSNGCTHAKNTQALQSDWPFAGESWNAIMGGSGSNRNLEKDQASTSSSPYDPGVRRHRILVVDDSKSDVFLMRRAIRNARIYAEIDVVQDGEAATHYLDAADVNENTPRPDLIVLDLNLPKESGDEVLKHLRETASFKDVKVLIVSSSDAPRDRAAVEGFAIAGYFKKPSSYAEFMRMGRIVKDLLE